MNAGERGWELVTITPNKNNVAYLRCEILRGRRCEELGRQQNHAAAMRAKHCNPGTGETWLGRGRTATWRKNKHDAGRETEKYRV